MRQRDNQEGRQVLDLVLELHPDTPRTRAKQWVLAGRVKVDGEVIRRPQQLVTTPSPEVELLDRHSTTLDCGTGWRIHPRLTLIYLDAAIAVVDKGPGLISTPAPNADISALSILQDFIEGRLKPLERKAASRPLPSSYRKLRLLPVHRLDQYTTGVFCMACNPRSRERLIEQLKARKMAREYVAFVNGKPKHPNGTWRNWLELSSDQTRQRIVTQDQSKAAGVRAQEAITHYETVAQYNLENGAVVSQLQVRLETGRRHQIRIQSAAAGLPIIGDRTYNEAYRRANVESAPIQFPRQALHAQRLILEHPETGAQLSWTAQLPPDMRQLVAKLRSMAS